MCGLYQAIKQRKNGTTVESPEQMLRKLFPDDPTNDIFDEVNKLPRRIYINVLL